MSLTPNPLVSVVVIGRNEGGRLVRCLDTIQAVPCRGFSLETIYVDSASSDGSPDLARALGAEVLCLAGGRQSAARARNAGWRAARGDCVLFLDGDTLLDPGFIAAALDALHDPKVGVVWGHRREIHPEHSFYNRVLDLDWIYPAGPSAFCGGDALMRRAVLDETGGFDDSLIAGEEPELCHRIRAAGWRIEHIDAPMTRHDLAITRLADYWRRAVRTGHAYAEIATRFRHSDDPLWLTDARRNLRHGGLIWLAPLLGLLALSHPPVLIGLFALATALLWRTARRIAWKSPDPKTRWAYALHSHLQQLPIFEGQIRYHLDRLRGRRRSLIEYKGPAPAATRTPAQGRSPVTGATPASAPPR